MAEPTVENPNTAEEWRRWTAATLYRKANELERMRAENDRLREALAFARSVIKSGEPWTPTCEEVIGGALHPRGDRP